MVLLPHSRPPASELSCVLFLLWWGSFLFYHRVHVWSSAFVLPSTLPWLTPPGWDAFGPISLASLSAGVFQRIAVNCSL